MLRADDSAEILETDGGGRRDSGRNTGAKALLALGVTVVTWTINLGFPLLKDPYPLGGIFPGDEQFAELLTDSKFVRYLKARVEEEAQWDRRRERPIVLGQNANHA